MRYIILPLLLLTSCADSELSTKVDALNVKVIELSEKVKSVEAETKTRFESNSNTNREILKLIDESFTAIESEILKR